MKSSTRFGHLVYKYTLFALSCDTNAIGLWVILFSDYWGCIVLQEIVEEHNKTVHPKPGSRRPWGLSNNQPYPYHK